MAKAIFVTLAVIVVGIILFAGWTIYARRRASQLGLPPPPIIPFTSRFKSSSSASAPSSLYPAAAPANIKSWINDKIHVFQRWRRGDRGGSYEGTSLSAAGEGADANAGVSGRGRGRGGFGPLDGDEAWDTSNVGHDADVYGPSGYYGQEEEEVGLHESTAYRGVGGLGGEGFGTGASSGRGRSRSREPPGYASVANGGEPAENPFTDGAERSDVSTLRDVSPRPLESGPMRSTVDSLDDQPQHHSERKSMFTEDM